VPGLGNNLGYAVHEDNLCSLNIGLDKWFLVPVFGVAQQLAFLLLVLEFINERRKLHLSVKQNAGKSYQHTTYVLRLFQTLCDVQNDGATALKSTN